MFGNVKSSSLKKRERMEKTEATKVKETQNLITDCSHVDLSVWGRKKNSNTTSRLTILGPEPMNLKTPEVITPTKRRNLKVN